MLNGAWGYGSNYVYNDSGQLGTATTAHLTFSKRFSFFFPSLAELTTVNVKLNLSLNSSSLSHTLHTSLGASLGNFEFSQKHDTK